MKNSLLYVATLVLMSLEAGFITYHVLQGSFQDLMSAHIALILPLLIISLPVVTKVSTAAAAADGAAAEFKWNTAPCFLGSTRACAVRASAISCVDRDTESAKHYDPKFCWAQTFYRMHASVYRIFCVPNTPSSLNPR